MEMKAPHPIASGEFALSTAGSTFVYRAYATDGCLLYVGMTSNVPQRIGGHWRSRSGWTPWAVRIAWDEYDSRLIAERVERHLIQSLAPQYNVQDNRDAPDPTCPHPNAEQAREIIGRLIDEAAWSS